MGVVTDPQLPPPSGVAPPPPVFPAPTAYPAAPAPNVPAPPPGAYQVPVGGYTAPAGSYGVPETSARPSGFLGMLALSLALVAALITPIIAGINAFEIGRLVPQGLSAGSGDLSALSPARDQVLWTELSFWTGTVLGIAAIVIGILAIRRRQGRGAGIAAIVVAAVAALLFVVVLVIAFATGSAAGFAAFTA
ncbi:hypothetical protein [Microbacterium sp. Y-01]|uniref:hypothetical protein n=1 Tax=Microbacterium sp. Y-01 TaxID=2048898 RepID=UPI001F152C63|nr:hypothetical protein [Microbacterium sp. Y-01]